MTGSNVAGRPAPVSGAALRGDHLRRDVGAGRAIGAVNLGQGFPTRTVRPAMLKAAQNAIAEGVNQYPPGLGIAPLREAIAAQRKRQYGVEYDPD